MVHDYTPAPAFFAADCVGKATLIIAKQRNGPTGDVPLTFIKEYARFEDRAEQAEPGN